MAVDRAARDRLACALAAYMRGDIDNFELDGVISVLSTDDLSAKRLKINLYFLYDDFKKHPLHLSEEGWIALLRTLAFLKSDLELPETQEGISRFKWQQIPSALYLLTLACFVDRAWGDVAGVIVGWMALGAIFYCLLQLLRLLPIEREAIDRPFYPFNDESAWLTHKPLIEALQIPKYDPAINSDQIPLRPLWVNRVMKMWSIPVVCLWMPAFALLSLSKIFRSRSTRHPRA